MATIHTDDNAGEVLKPIFDACVCMIVLQTFFFTLRYTARIWIKKTKLGLDDLALLCSYIANVGICVIGLKMYYIELQGNPPAHEPLTQSPEQVVKQLEPVLKCQYAIAQLVFVGLLLPKLSLLFLYLRVFGFKRTFRICTYSAMVFVSVPALAYSLSQFFACRPIEYFWDKAIPGGHCLNYDALYRWGQGVNTIQDIVVLVLPLYPLWELQAPISRKVGWSIVFMTGGMGLVAGIIKWVNFLKYTSEVVAPFLTGKLITWVVIESPIYLIACCVAGSGPLLTTTVKVLRSTSFGTKRSTLPTVQRSSQSGFVHLVDENGAGLAEARGSTCPNNQAFEMDRLERGIVVTTDVSVTGLKNPAGASS